MSPAPSASAPLRVGPRVEAARGALAPAGVDALVVTDPLNVRYLCGFTGSAGWMWLDAERLVLVTDERYRERAPSELAAVDSTAELEVTSDHLAAVVAALGRPGTRVGLEAGHLSWSDARLVADRLDTEPVPTEGLVEGLRSVKDAAELDRMQRAAAITDQALAEVAPRLADRAAEVEIADELEFAIRHLGADGVAYEPIVASGPNAAVPHHRAGPRPLGPGDLVIVDVGSTVDGYRSDMTRTFVVGEPDPAQRARLDLVEACHDAAYALVRPGVEAAEVDAAARSVAERAGRLDEFLHATGHGVGLAIHELPRVRPGSAVTLVPGHVITVEPGLYTTGVGGARLEDTVVVTDTGARRLTGAPRRPEVDARST